MNVNPPTSVTRPVIPPSCIVISPHPSGTTILEPLVMMFCEPLVFDPRPALVSCFTAGIIAAVAGAPGIGTK